MAARGGGELQEVRCDLLPFSLGELALQPGRRAPAAVQDLPLDLVMPIVVITTGAEVRRPPERWLIVVGVDPGQGGDTRGPDLNLIDV